MCGWLGSRVRERERKNNTRRRLKVRRWALQSLKFDIVSVSLSHCEISLPEWEREGVYERETECMRERERQSVWESEREREREREMGNLLVGVAALLLILQRPDWSHNWEWTTDTLFNLSLSLPFVSVHLSFCPFSECLLIRLPCLTQSLITLPPSLPFSLFLFYLFNCLFTSSLAYHPVSLSSSFLSLSLLSFFLYFLSFIFML